MSAAILAAIPVVSDRSRIGFEHPLLRALPTAFPEARNVSLWMGVLNKGAGVTFLPSRKGEVGKMILDLDSVKAGVDIVIGVTIDKHLPSHSLLKLQAHCVSADAQVLKLAMKWDQKKLGPAATAMYGATVTDAGSYATELTDYDEMTTAAPVPPAAKLMSDVQAVFAKIASTCTLMDHSHLPVKIAADVTNCPDFAEFQRALDAAGFTLRFAPKDAAAANLSTMSEADVLALLKRIPSDTLARELTKRGMEVIG